MPRMMVMWTALPNGLTGDKAHPRVRLSVYVSMRLQADGAGDTTLGAFTGVLNPELNWPALLQPGQVEFLVQSPQGGQATATIVRPPPPPDPALWRALFSASTPVTSHAPDDLTGRPINTYPVTAVLEHVQQGHLALTRSSPLDLPSRPVLTKAFLPLHEAFVFGSGARGDGLPRQKGPQDIRASLASNFFFQLGPAAALRDRVAEAAALAHQVAAPSPPGTLVEVVKNTGDVSSHFAQLYAFHSRAPEDAAGGPGRQAAQRGGPAHLLDFHQALAALSQYPELLRRLGLVIDLELDADALPESTLDSPSAQLRVGPVFTDDTHFTNYSPLTAYILEGSTFFTAAPMNPAGPETLGGLLNLALPDAFDLVQVDVDSLGLRVLNMMAGTAQENSDEDAETAPGGTPLPRTAGISMVRQGHGGVLAGRMGAAKGQNQELAQNPDRPVTLFAEDLTRGFRFDVFDAQTQRWRSLHKRTGTYVFKDHEAGPLEFTHEDEGLTQPAAVQRAEGAPEVRAQLYVHESLMHWQGWSLAAPRPGKTMGRDGPDTLSNRAPEGGLGLEVNFRATPGTLPRLRFGREYRLRARAVDLAGNSLELTEADERLRLLGDVLMRVPPVLPGPAKKFVYRRFDPVLSPVPVPRGPFTEGESLERLVIRSNLGESVGACTTRLTALTAARPEGPARYTDVNERHLAPPKVAQWTAEASGLLDAGFGGGGDAARMYEIARQEKGHFPEVAPEARLRVSYLPDPLSAGASLCGLPGVAPGLDGDLDERGQLVFSKSNLTPEAVATMGPVTQLDWGKDWPERLPFRIQLAEPANPGGPTEPPSWDAQARVLTVHLAKGEQAPVRLSSFLTPGELPALGIWDWMVEQQGQPGPRHVQTAEAGGMWMLTPFRQLTLVHAVQQPLVTPTPETMMTRRMRPGDTFVHVGGDVPVDGKSTAKLDLLASWKDLQDVAPTGDTALSAHAHVFEVPIHPLPPGAPQPTPQDSAVVPIGLFLPATGAQKTDTLHLLVPEPVDDDAEIGVDSANTFLSRHELGDTRYHRVRYQWVATTRFREYFPREVTEHPEQLIREGDAVEVDVLSSARPAAPQVLYALPVFEWSRTVDASGRLVRTRKGGGVRVYLERPWFSSGEGELLGVLMLNPDVPSFTEQQRPFLSHWGNDPIWATGRIASRLTLAHFPRAVASASRLTLQELPGAPVFDVAGHTVEFDRNRDLRFCDLQLDPGPVYCPFVRLALARYQPHSMPGHNLELSHGVLTDFVQLLPERTVTVTPQPDGTFGLQVEGLTYRFNIADLTGPQPDGDPAPELVEVSIEERIPGTSDEAGWRPAVSTREARVTATRTVKAGQGGSEGPLWVGQVRLPADRAPGQFRVVIQEREHLLDDRHAPDSFPGARRLVFAETLEL